MVGFCLFQTQNRRIPRHFSHLRGDYNISPPACQGFPRFSEGKPQAAVQPLPCPPQTAGHGGFVDPQPPGDLGDGQLLLKLHVYHLPLAGRQLRHGVRQTPPQTAQAAAVVLVSLLPLGQLGVIKQ